MGAAARDPVFALAPFAERRSLADQFAEYHAFH
eukprot:COSAG01_NODE_40003_length_469_cov_0.694595_1_plen_32_part_01